MEINYGRQDMYTAEQSRVELRKARSCLTAPPGPAGAHENKLIMNLGRREREKGKQIRNFFSQIFINSFHLSRPHSIVARRILVELKLNERKRERLKWVSNAEGGGEVLSN